MHEIIENGLDFLKQTNFQFSIPQYSSINIENNKNIFNMCFEDKINQSNIEKIQLFKIIAMFALFDLFIDLKNPNTAGDSFKKKYENLPSSSDAEIILKETFRIAKIIRNASIHNLSSLQQIDQTLLINYSFNNTNFNLEISEKGLTLFHSIIYLYISEINGDKEYFIGLIRAMYNDMKDEIESIQDEFGSILNSISNEIKLGYNIRDTLLNPIYTIDNTKVTFTNILNVKNLGKLDLFIKLNNNIYLIPSEALDKNKTITLSEIKEKWTYTFNHPLFSKVIFD
ncbi:hypothetical protein ACG907_12470 [Acinetobacter bereziniae]|uniref:hypothetical protein n=1 Tax=Acinetobacter bereziniae TaxID=106648 RepID=UPI002953BE83|nr:hypothetical protein [Acinetobacter bereziniae]MDV8157607.1 hypothetical protein [Acinetobacter bereziniae]